MLRTQAVCRPSSQQNRQGKFELFAWTLSPNFFRLNWTFRLPPKRQLSIVLNFFSIYKFVFDFCCLSCFATTRVTMRFRAIKTGFSTGLYPVYATSYCVTTKISWLDRLPNLLSNGAPLKSSIICGSSFSIGSIFFSFFIKNVFLNGTCCWFVRNHPSVAPVMTVLGSERFKDRTLSFLCCPGDKCKTKGSNSVQLKVRSTPSLGANLTKTVQPCS